MPVAFRVGVGNGSVCPTNRVDEVECPLHGGAFEIRTGRPAAFPVVVPVETYRVRVLGDEVQVALNGLLGPGLVRVVLAHLAVAVAVGPVPVPLWPAVALKEPLRLPKAVDVPAVEVAGGGGAREARPETEAHCSREP